MGGELAIHSIVGPKGIPKDRVQILHDAFYQEIQEPGFKDVLEKLSLRLVHRNSQEIQKLIEKLYEGSGEILKKIEEK